MTNNKSFKSETSLDKRIQLAAKIRALYAERLPVIVEKTASSNAPEISKKKFLVPADMPVSKFFMEVKRQLQVTGDHSAVAIFLFVNKSVLPPSGTLMSQIYEKYKDEDGFMYVTYSGENTFGAQILPTHL